MGIRGPGETKCLLSCSSNSCAGWQPKHTHKRWFETAIISKLKWNQIIWQRVTWSGKERGLLQTGVQGGTLRRWPLRGVLNDEEQSAMGQCEGKYFQAGWNSKCKGPWGRDGLVWWSVTQTLVWLQHGEWEGEWGQMRQDRWAGVHPLFISNK